MIHYTGMESCAAALDRLCDAGAEVSAHYLISEQGTVMSLVAEEARAWHAGAGQWAGRGDVNSRSIGVELANTGTQPFPEPQMAALETILRRVSARWDIAPQGVIGHSDMAPERKQDPGPRFDWRRLALQGLSVWPKGTEYAAPDPDLFAAALAAFGYPQAPAGALFAAFRSRFRPARALSGAGVEDLDSEDMALALDLARSFSVDRPVRNA